MPAVTSLRLTITGRGGSIAGSGVAEAETAKLALLTVDLNLAGIVGSLRETSLADAHRWTLTPAPQSVEAD